jgi:chromosome segregation ATPase
MGGRQVSDGALGVALDAALKGRLRAVLAERTVTESVLRRLAEEGAACALILEARLARSERQLSELSGDPESSLAEIAEAMRSINELKPDLEELHALLGGLDAYARELRSTWLRVG